MALLIKHYIYIYSSSSSSHAELKLKNPNSSTKRKKVLLQMEVFYSQWIVRKKELLDDLLSVPEDRPDLQTPLISRALSHYAEYCHRKSQLAERDVFQVFSPHWLTSFERSFLWLGGVKPCMIFRLIPTDLTVDQRRLVDALRQEAVQSEVELERRKRMVEETMVLLMALARVHGAHRNGEVRAEVADRVVQLMRAVYMDADGLRRTIVTRSLEILNTNQTILFFAGATQLHLHVRRSGLRRNIG